jgi:hypothetical protein
VHAARAFATAAVWLPRPLATTARRTALNTDMVTSWLLDHQRLVYH